METRTSSSMTLRRAADRFGATRTTCEFAHSAAGTAKDWGSLLQRVQRRHGCLVAVDLTPEGAALDQGRVPLHVVRAIVPGMIPISFGYGREPLGLPAVRALRRGAAGIPFPHPFT